MDQLALLSRAGLIIAIYMSFVWVLSVILRNTGVVDVFWGLGFILVAAFYALFAEGASWRIALVLVLVNLWGLRLALHVLVRGHGQGEDKRYAAWRARRPRQWWWRSYFTVFLLQGVLMWIVSLPLLGAQTGRLVLEFTFTDALGLLLFSVGFVFEVVADWQLLRFQRDPANRGRVLDSGLWAWSRHPNYFGEMLIWWGFYGLALAPGQLWTIFGPALITFLLLRVSGVTLLEKTIADSKPGYREYMARTSAFIPRPPRRD
jgi:steroid 5-alpha reductase family enzyme